MCHILPVGKYDKYNNNCAFRTVTKGLLKVLEDLEIKGRMETIQNAALLRTARILRRIQGLEETCYHSNFRERPSANSDIKNSQGVNNKNNILTFH